MQEKALTLSQLGSYKRVSNWVALGIFISGIAGWRNDNYSMFGVNIAIVTVVTSLALALAWLTNTRNALNKHSTQGWRAVAKAINKVNWVSASILGVFTVLVALFTLGFGAGIALMPIIASFPAVLGPVIGFPLVRLFGKRS